MHNLTPFRIHNHDARLASDTLINSNHVSPCVNKCRWRTQPMSPGMTIQLTFCFTLHSKITSEIYTRLSS